MNAPSQRLRDRATESGVGPGSSCLDIRRVINTFAMARDWEACSATAVEEAFPGYMDISTEKGDRIWQGQPNGR